MIKILVISDTHQDINIIKKISLTHQNFDYFLHLGDSELPPSLILPFVGVKGNCDCGLDYPTSKRIKTPFGDIYMEHGNTFIDRDYILKTNARIFLCGHSHVHDLKKIDDDHYFANPGSTTRPRDGTEGTYLEIYLDNNYIDFKFRKIDY